MRRRLINTKLRGGHIHFMRLGCDVRTGRRGIDVCAAVARAEAGC